MMMLKNKGYDTNLKEERRQNYFLEKLKTFAL